MHTFQQLAAQAEARFSDGTRFPQGPAGLYDPLRYFMKLGGKRVRPVVCLMAAELFDEIGADAWHAAAAVELFHNFTLIHDDIMDKAPLRRGAETVHTRWNLSTAILSGDALCIHAYSELAQISKPLAPLMALFNRTAIEVCEGQQMDMDFETRDDVSEDEYIQMIALKTSVLLACSLKLGALVGGSTVGAADKLYEFGKSLGIAFQLQDDYLDAYGDPGKLGKQQGGDILADKKTFLAITAQRRADARNGVELASLVGKRVDEKVERVKAIFSATGAGDACRAEVEKYSQRAFDCLEALPVVASRKAPLRELAAMLLNRES